MEIKELICIGCPMGCQLSVQIDGEKLTVSGNTCPRGADYAQKELTDPRRIVTSTVKVEGGKLPVVSVKTVTDIPKDKIFACMNALKKVTVSAPVSMGQIVLANVADTGVDVIATKEISCC